MGLKTTVLFNSVSFDYGVKLEYCQDPKSKQWFQRAGCPSQAGYVMGDWTPISNEPLRKEKTSIQVAIPVLS